MDYSGGQSGGLGKSRISSTDAKKADTVSLEAFITSNWQILTIFGVFAGFTNYLSGTENTWLVTLGFLLTFIVELEILQLLLRIKNGSFLLKMFTLLSAVFILIFAGFIYSNLISTLFTSFGVAIYPLINENKGFLVRVIFFVSVLIVLVGVFMRMRATFETGLHPLFAGQNKVLLAMIIVLLVLVAALVSMWLNRAPPTVGPAPTTTTIEAVSPCSLPLKLIGNTCCSDDDGNGMCDEPVTTTTSPPPTVTVTLAPTIQCFTNSDCGNQTQTKICYEGDVYLQQTTPSCQKPGTPDSKCSYRTGLVGETITQKAAPFEHCSRACKDGICNPD
jgi:hypothetical protein